MSEKKAVYDQGTAKAVARTVHGTTNGDGGREKSIDGGKILPSRKPDSDVVVDGATGEVVEERTWASWENLCEQKDRTVDKFLPKLKVWVRYRDFIALDRLMGIQRKYGMVGGGKRDVTGYMVALLRAVMVHPKIRTEADARAVKKADGRAMLMIIGDVLGEEDESYIALREELGEEPAS